MTAFYDDKVLEDELAQVSCPEGDLDFAYLFEYEPPCSDVASGGQGLSEVLHLFLLVCFGSSSIDSRGALLGFLLARSGFASFCSPQCYKSNSQTGSEFGSHASMKLASLCKLMVPFLRLHLSLI